MKKSEKVYDYLCSLTEKEFKILVKNAGYSHRLSVNFEKIEKGIAGVKDCNCKIISILKKGEY